MIISFKYKFIFIKNYKTAGSSIESYLYQFLNKDDIVAQTRDFRGINHISDFNPDSLIKNFDIYFQKKYINNKMAFFSHMPAWMIRERIGDYNYDKFYKFSVLRNPWDLVVSHYNWLNSSNNPLRVKTEFNKILEDIENVYPASHNIFNYYKITDLNKKNKIIVDYLCNFENLNTDLKKIFLKLGVPFDGELKIFKKVSGEKSNYKDYFNNHSKKIIQRKFQNEIELMKYSY